MRSLFSARVPATPIRRAGAGRRRLVAGAVAAITFASLAATMSVAPAQAAPVAAVPAASGQTSAGTKSPHPVKQVCSTPNVKGKLRCFALQRTDVAGHKGVNPADTPAGYGPSDLQSAYDLPGGGSGQTVAIVDAFDDPNAEADLAIYRSQYGLSACTTANGCFSKVNQRGVVGSYPSPDSGWATEISLDVDMVSAACPACHILLVEADDNFTNNLAAGVAMAVTLGAKFVSNSYGGPEDPSQTAFDSTYSQPGVVVTASTGDGGYGTSYPATSPGVTAVGGTSLTANSSTRGWTESVWSGAGSGCSSVEPKPAFQTDTGCANRTVADVSAVADPNTGVAVYDTYQKPGWAVYGGTSASSPLIAATYALAGTPVAGTSPNAYPYAAPAGALNDVTSGNNGSCSPAYLCTGETGYDGPSGLGTPNGVAAFTTGPHGTITGVVTDNATHHAVVGAQVSAGDLAAPTDATGHYSISAPVGTYTLTVSAYGYRTAAITGVTVANNATVTKNVALTSVPSVSVSGTVTDGSGHGWPLYAKITLDGVPGAPIYTDPFTGHYSLSLPRSATYAMHIAPVYPGYTTKDITLTLGTGAKVVNAAVKVDLTECDVAPGYHTTYSGAPTQHFDGTTKPAGWSVVGDTTQGVWGFTDDGARGNLTGGSGGFAIIDSDHLGTGKSQDTSLISPTYNLTGQATPVLDLNSYYKAFLDTSTANVDVSVNGGSSWTNVLSMTTDDQQGPLELPLPTAANKSNVKVRFHYTGSFSYFWEVDDVFVGQKTCGPTAGGLVAGFVTDHNTGLALNGATVTSAARPTDKAMSAATPDDGALRDGFYWLFSSLTGKHDFTAALGKYTAVTASVNVGANYVTRQSFSLTAGHITTPAGGVSVTETLGQAKSATVTYTNDGTKQVHVDLGEKDGGFQIAGVPAAAVYAGEKGATVQHKAGKYSAHRLAVPGTKGPVVAPGRSSTPSDAPWTSIADYPTPISNNVAVYLDGKLYDFGGYDGSSDVAAGYVYDPATQNWTATAPMSVTREAAAAVVVDGKIYVTGGWGPDGSPTAITEVYDPSADSWTTLAPNPDPHAAASYGELGGKIYLVGGCETSSCGVTNVDVYDPTANSWSTAADYPAAVSWASCGPISGLLYCAGGVSDAGGTSAATYVYDPSSDSWAAKADMPTDQWGGGFAAVGGQLVLSGGVIASSSAITNEGWTYDPTADAWASLPNSNNAFYRMGSACGFYKIGGGTSSSDPSHAESEVLPGFDSCTSAGVNVPWLTLSKTSFNVAPGASVAITVTLNSARVSQPGTYTAAITAATDSPYSLTPVPVTMIVNPPSSWGKITGTVTGTSCTGTRTPLVGATIAITSWATHYTLTTDANGKYVLWLDRRNNPLTLIAAKDGWIPKTDTLSITAGATTTENFALHPSKACN